MRDTESQLLEALRACLEALTIAFEFDGGDVFGIHHNAAIDAVIAAERAIAKATSKG